MKRFYKFIVASAGCLSAFLVTQKLDGAIQREWWEVFIPIWCATPAYFIITSPFIFIRNVLTSRETSVDEIFGGESYISSLSYFLTFPLMFLRYNNLIVMPWKFILIPYLPMLLVIIIMGIAFLVYIPSAIKSFRREKALKRFPPEDLEKLNWESMRHCLLDIKSELPQFEFSEPNWDYSRKYTIEARKNGYIVGAGFYFRNNVYAVCTYIYGRDVSQLDIEGFTLNPNNSWDYFSWLVWTEDEYSESRFKKEIIVRLKQIKPFLYQNNKKMRIRYRPWSKLQTALYRIIDPNVGFQIHCVTYPMRSKTGYANDNMPRYWITIGKKSYGTIPKYSPKKN